MKKIGSIGLGAMGGSYARFLIENNYKVYGLDQIVKTRVPLLLLEVYYYIISMV